jgi:putative flippase GtrA
MIVTALQYPLVYLFQYLVGLALLYVLVELGHLPKAIAPLVMVVTTLLMTFLLSRYFITRASSRNRQRRIRPLIGFPQLFIRRGEELQRDSAERASGE